MREKAPWNDYIQFYYDVREVKCEGVGELSINEELEEKKVIWKDETDKISPDKYFEEKL